MLKLAEPAAPDLDEDLLARAVAGDEAAFTGLVRRHEAMVFGLARHFLNDAGAAEDIAQEVFLELHRNLGGLVSDAHVRHWLRRVAANRCIDRMRQKARHAEQPLEFMPDRGAFPVVPDVLLESRLRALVAALAPQPRMVIVLRYQEDLDPAEIAGVLDMPVNTVKSHLRRSVALLRARLRAESSTRIFNEP
jgi:RNA polymerase sigma-70 factor (ECF subfamily)